MRLRAGEDPAPAWSSPWVPRWSRGEVEVDVEVEVDGSFFVERGVSVEEVPDCSSEEAGSAILARTAARRAWSLVTLRC
jgi:hypothetical protein